MLWVTGLRVNMRSPMSSDALETYYDEMTSENVWGLWIRLGNESHLKSGVATFHTMSKPTIYDTAGAEGFSSLIAILSLTPLIYHLLL